MINNTGGIENFIETEINPARIRPFSFSYDDRENFIVLNCTYRDKIIKRPKNYKYGNTLVFCLKFYDFKRPSFIIDVSKDDTNINFYAHENDLYQLTSVGHIQSNIFYGFCSASILK